MNRILSLIVTILFALCIEAGIFMLIAHWWGMTAAITVIAIECVLGVSRNLVGIIFYTRKVLLTSHYEKRLFEYASQPRVAGSDIRLLSYLWS